MIEFETCQKKQSKVEDIFLAASDENEKYRILIKMGKELGKLEAQGKIPENIVKGCQSVMYLQSWMEGGKVYFAAESDALISAGLASILIQVYSGEVPETILKCPPTYLEALGLSDRLTPNRANGLYSIHLRMKQDALRHLIQRDKQAS
jgi:cysteine desulfuration protein SufE